MPRKRIVALAVAAIILMMAGAVIYEAFDIHDTKPFPIDPEPLLCMMGSMLVLCIGTVALCRHSLIFSLSLSELLSAGVLGLSRISMQRHQAIEVERLLFSPPLSAASLRI